MQIFGTNAVDLTVLSNAVSSAKDEFDWFDQKVTPKTPIEFKTDPVALSCAAWRQRFSDPYPDLKTLTTTEEDHRLANVIRSHYVSQITLQRLKARKISQFREKLGAFLVGNRSLHKDEIGMLYHLPYFYYEDLEYQSVIAQSTTADVDIRHGAEIELMPLKTIESRRRGGVTTQFWWTDQQRRPYYQTVAHQSEHVILYRSLWEFAKISVCVRAHQRLGFNSGDFCHYRIANMQLLGVTK